MTPEKDTRAPRAAALWQDRPRTPWGELAAIRVGAGPRVLLLHGVGLRAEAWAGQIDALSSRFEVIAPDMPGHGESPALDGAATLPAYAARAVAALDGPAWIVGHSMGALIALEIATTRPDLTHGVAALNAIFRRAPEAAAAVKARAAALDGVSSSDPTAPLRRWFGDVPSPEADACRRWLTDVDPAGYKAAYARFAAEDGPSDAALTALAAPALFLTGAEEPNSTPAMAAAMAALAPKGRAEIIAGAAHMAPMTHPDTVTAALLALFEARDP